MSKREITVRIHRQDTIDWLDGDTELADQYMVEVASRMAADLDADVAIVDGYPIGGGSPIAYDSACDDGLMQEAQDSYEAACEALSTDWAWAEKFDSGRPWGKRRYFSADEVREAAQQALDNWDWDAEPEKAPAMRAALQRIRDGQSDSLTLDRSFADIWDWLDELAR